MVVLVGEFILPGKVVIINHGQGIVSTYYHLSEILVKEGEFVKKGQTIAKVGVTGMVTGAHLHWGMYVFGVDVNPLNFVNNEYE
jgi:murein DD-endopeptidase MepM/ murein hydrolase activator NlpD